MLRYPLLYHLMGVHVPAACLGQWCRLSVKQHHLFWAASLCHSTGTRALCAPGRERQPCCLLQYRKPAAVLRASSKGRLLKSKFSCSTWLAVAAQPLPAAASALGSSLDGTYSGVTEHPVSAGASWPLTSLLRRWQVSLLGSS